MKRILACVCALLLAASMTGALAAAVAIPNQKLALRTGPNTRYAWLDTRPKSTDIIAYEYEEGNDVTWVLVQYELKGKLYRGYTGLKRMSVRGDIPWANHFYYGTTANCDCTVLAAPSPKGAYRASLLEGDWVSVLEYEDDYAFIEFYDRDERRDSRGYVEYWLLDDREGVTVYDYGYDMDDGDDWNGWEDPMPATPNQRLALRGCPRKESAWLGNLSAATRISAVEYEEGNGVTWVLVEYCADDEWYRAYTGLKRMTVHGDIPWADHLYIGVTIARDGEVLAAPYANGAHRGWLTRNDTVDLLKYVGDFAFIEYYDYDLDDYCRGYVPQDMIR